MLVRIGTFFALVAGLGVFAASCGDSPCDRACNRYNNLSCSTTCDCQKCDSAPSACDDYFDCVAGKLSCLGVYACDRPTECDSFVQDSCGF